MEASNSAAGVLVGPGAGLIQLGGELVEMELAMLIVDIVKSESSLRSLGDREYARKLMDFKDEADALIRRYNGCSVIDTGDGFLSGHRHVDDAVSAAHALANSSDFALRFGVHRGPVLSTRYGIVGAAVYEAFEIGNESLGHEVWLTEAALLAYSGTDGEIRNVGLPRSGDSIVLTLAAGSRTGRGG